MQNTKQISNGVKPLIIANWKMNPSNSKDAFDLASAVQNGLRGTEVDVVLCPPFVYLQGLISAPAFAKGYGGLAFGSQDCFWEEGGAYTGEVSAQMLQNLGCSYVILGHSERKKLGETPEMTAQKTQAALLANLVPVVCIGEHIAEEMESILRAIPLKNVSKIVFVYEPEGAISTKPGAKPASPEQLERALSAMRALLLKKAGKEAAQNARILYGGSVNRKNILEFMKKDIQGALAGAASLHAQEFIQLVKNAVSR